MQTSVPTYHLFDRKSDAQRERDLLRQRANVPERAPRLLCARCGNTITHQDQRIAVNGAHAHSCTNPHGLTFYIGCFRDAPGCAPLGAATTEFTWFPGYAWRITDCAKCGEHLGWLFTSSGDGFYGLIIDRLTSGKNE
jgi:hypothetical protein